ncbi:helix-turn-helix transcriptional regulator [Actinocatenispora thailandica]|uniref:helix-turn-helix transcriptional regulator n=1 Tax=Actinocatenispora thailandica TaxID=227318 RepID=UPI00194E1DE4|nr:DUF6879 family protein [Actinocatenispora thailandica]
MNEVLTVRGEHELVARAGHLFDSASAEFLCAATDLHTWSRTRLRSGVGRRVGAARERGLLARKLFTAVALADPADADELARLDAAGVEVRICRAELPHETIILDRRIAILAEPPVDGVRTFRVLPDPGLVAGVRALFAAAWDHAVPLGEWRRDPVPVLAEPARAVLRELAAGRTDEAAARSLGLSVRTYRRRVAELMRLLGAESRFQAGVLARTLVR